MTSLCIANLIAGVQFLIGACLALYVAIAGQRLDSLLFGLAFIGMGVMPFRRARRRI